MTDPGMSDDVREVDVTGWVAAAGAARREGHDYLDLVAGVDRVDTVEVVARLVRSIGPVRPGVRLVVRVLPGEPLETLTGVFPAAAWHERELAEMFGVTIVGGADLRPLLRRQAVGAPPLLRSTVLAARVARPWPGAADGADDRRGSRRRQAPPGVVADWLAEDSP